MKKIHNLQMQSRDAPKEVTANQEESRYVPYTLLMNSLNFPPCGADKAVKTLVGDERRQAKLELAYLRGELGLAIKHYKSTSPDSKLQLCAMNLAIKEAMAVGNFGQFYEALCELVELCNDEEMADEDNMLLEISRHTVGAVIKTGFPPLEFENLSPLPQTTRKSYYLAKTYYDVFGSFDFNSAMCRLDALLTCHTSIEYTPQDIYLYLICGAVFFARGQPEKARQYVETALDLALPDGFIMPLVEMMTVYGSVLEQCLKERDEVAYDKVVQLTERYYNNTAAIHNRLTGKNLCTTMTFSQIQLAQLVALGLTNQAIAKTRNCSFATIKRGMENLFDKLTIRKRSKVKDLVL